MHNILLSRIFCVLLAALFWLVSPAFTAAAPEPAARFAPGSAEALYAEANAFSDKLEDDAAVGSHRENWLAGIRQFRRVQLIRKTEKLTTGSMFMQGRLYRQMYDRFGVPLDLDNALDLFYSLAAAYPNSSLADDALYQAAEAALLHPAKKEQAGALLRKIMKEYGGSDHAGMAAKRLRQLSAMKKSPAQTPMAEKIGSAKPMASPQAQPQTAPSPAPGPVALVNRAKRTPAEAAAEREQREAEQAAAARISQTETKQEQQATPRQETVTEAQKNAAPLRRQTSGAADKALIEPVKYWSTDDYTRIVIPVSAPVFYTSTLIEQRGEHPRRLVVDFVQSLLGPDNKKPITIGDGLLRQVRTGQYTADTVRVVLDIESLSDYRIFSLPNPFRVIVDIHGVKKSGARQKSASLTASIEPAANEGETQSTQAPEEKTESPASGSVRRSQISGQALTPPVALEQNNPATGGVIALDDQKKWRPGQGGNTPLKPGSGNKQLSLAQQLGLGVRHIVIDPGHGGKDPGAMAFGLKEKDIVLKLAKIVAQKLEQNNFDVSFTRDTDEFIPLEERTAIANTRKADLFLSLHVNAHSNKNVGGVETYFLDLATDADAMRVAAQENATSTHSIGELQDILSDLLKNAKIDESSQLAQYVHRTLSRGLKRGYGIKNLGVKKAPFYVLIGAEMPSVLVEISFITNQKEGKLLQDEAYLEKVATEIVNGVNAYARNHQSAALRH